MTRKELKDLKEDAKAWGVYADAYQAGYDAGKAEKALQEREERSKGCQVCTGFLSGELELYWRYERRDDPYKLVTLEGKRMPVRCCPLCGRPLKGE